MSESLPQRMREAADVLREASMRYAPSRSPGYFEWSAEGLNGVANGFEAEDAAAAEREALVEELAHVLLESWVATSQIESRRSLFDDALDSARKLIDAGWTKQVQS